MLYARRLTRPPRAPIIRQAVRSAAEGQGVEWSRVGRWQETRGGHPAGEKEGGSIVVSYYMLRVSHDHRVHPLLPATGLPRAEEIRDHQAARPAAEGQGVEWFRVGRWQETRGRTKAENEGEDRFSIHANIVISTRVLRVLINTTITIIGRHACAATRRVERDRVGEGVDLVARRLW